MRKLLPLVILLLAPACYAQTNVPIIAGVATADVGRSTKFKVIVNAAVQIVLTSNTTPAPYDGQTITMIFAENSTGGFAVSFASNISNPCSVNTAANSITICQFTFDSGSNQWAGLTIGNGAQTNVANNWSAQQNFNADISCFKGPNPYVDIRCFGARAVNPNTTPAATGLTATCTATQFTCTISAASTFINGDGIICYGCGAAQSMTTPTIASVTPSVSLAGTATLHTTPGPTGATTYNYKMIARDRNGGLTAASAVVSTTTGSSTLGTAGTVNITSMSRSNQTVTVTTASAHGFLVGCSTTTCGEVFISGANSESDPTFRGWFSVTSAVDTTHFTFIGGPSTQLGATTSATGGTAIFYTENLVCASSLPAGAVELYLLSDRANPGTYAVIAAGYPNSAGSTPDLCIDDLGSPMVDNQAFPPFITAAAPWASATSDHLSTTITAGAGTTNLTLANSVGTTVNGATIRLDAAPGILAAAAASRSTGGGVLIPVDPSGNPFVVNSWLNTNNGTSTQVQFAQHGSLYLNDTFEDAVSTGGGIKYIGDVIPNGTGFPPPGAWGIYPTVSVNTAHPGFWFSSSTSSGTQNALTVHGLNISSVPANGSLLMVGEGGFNQSYDHINFVSGNGVNDYISIGLMLRTSTGQNVSNVNLDFVEFAPGGGTDGASHTPTFWCRSCGTVFIPRSYSVHRGMLAESSGISIADSGVAYINGGGDPLITMFTPTATSSLQVGNVVVLDTIAHPCVAVLTGPFGPVVPINFLRQPNGGCIPSSGVPGVTGNYKALLGFNNPTFANSIATTVTTDATTGANIVSQFFNAHLSVDPNHEAFIRAPQMAQPTCVVSAGGSLGTGTYNFQVAPSWTGTTTGNYDPASISSTNCTATTGNQTITVSWTPVAGNPTGYGVYTNGVIQRQTSGVGSTCATPFVPGGSTSSWVLNTAIVSTCGFQPTTIATSGPTALLPGTQGIATPSLTLANGIKTGNAAPTCSSTGLGTGTCTGFSTNSDDISGAFQLQAGSGAASTGTITLTFNVPSPNTTFCMFNLAGQTVGWAAGAIIQPIFGSSTNQAAWNNNGTALVNTNAYTVFYQCNRH